jgi:hypothetical protein
MLDLPDRPLKSIDEVCELLEETINLVRPKVFDLFPQPQQQDQTSETAPLPAPGESIDDPPNDHSRVITVEVG